MTTVISHAPLPKVKAHVVNLYRHGIEFAQCEDGTFHVTQHSPNVSRERVALFLRVCHREIHGLLAVDSDERAMSRLQEMRFQVARGTVHD